MQNLQLILTTVATKESGQALCEALVEERLIACGTILPKGDSYFVWESEIQHTQEFLLLLKTSKEKVQEVEKRFDSLHPYDVPEFLVLSPSHASEAYVGWLLESVA